MKLNKPAYLFPLSILVGWIGEQLFWEQSLGINFPLLVMIVVGLGFYFANSLDKKPTRHNLWLLVPIAFFSIMLFIRKEPLTTFLNFWAALIFLALFAHSFLDKKWWLYGFTQYIVEGLIFVFNVFKNPPSALAQNNKEISQQTTWHKIQPYLKGLLFALPVVLFFTVLLSEADPIFKDKAELVLGWLIIDDLATLIIKIIFILILSWGLSGTYLHAFNQRKEKLTLKKENGQKLGFIEAIIMLVSVNLLFLSFVAIQFRYFFGGQSNINFAGYTYAEYARRGFGELVTVAAFSLLFFMGLSAIAARKTNKQLNSFSIQGVALLSFVSVILISAFQRLNLYETVYGFTRLRIYTHVFIIWLGIYLAVVVILEISKRHSFFALALVLSISGFVITLNMLNVDAFIVHKNIQHLDTIAFTEDPNFSRSSSPVLDIAYLASLSEDATTALNKTFTQAKDHETQTYLAGALVCHAIRNDNYAFDDTDQWPSFHFSQWRSNNLWQILNETDFMEHFKISVLENNVTIDGEATPCYYSYYEVD